MPTKFNHTRFQPLNKIMGRSSDCKLPSTPWTCGPGRGVVGRVTERLCLRQPDYCGMIIPLTMPHTISFSQGWAEGHDIRSWCELLEEGQNQTLIWSSSLDSSVRLIVFLSLQGLMRNSFRVTDNFFCLFESGSCYVVQLASSSIWPSTQCWDYKCLSYSPKKLKVFMILSF